MASHQPNSNACFPLSVSSSTNTPDRHHGNEVEGNAATSRPKEKGRQQIFNDKKKKKKKQFHNNNNNPNQRLKNYTHNNRPNMMSNIDGSLPPFFFNQGPVLPPPNAVFAPQVMPFPSRPLMNPPQPFIFPQHHQPMPNNMPMLMPLPTPTQHEANNPNSNMPAPPLSNKRLYQRNNDKGKQHEPRITRGDQMDYAQHFVDTRKRPQNFIRDPDMSVIPENQPLMRELMEAKDKHNEEKSFNPVYLNCDLRKTALSIDHFGTKFDAILIDPPMEEYARRAPDFVDCEKDIWTWEEIRNLPIEDIADAPCFVFLWVGCSEGLEEGRKCFKMWGCRRIDDICWLKQNNEEESKSSMNGIASDSIFARTKEHCLVGLKAQHLIEMNPHLMHPNLDTDIIITEEPPYGSTRKPDYLYNIIEHLVQGRRRIELFGEDHNLRRGWLTVGNKLSSSNFNKQAYVKNFVGDDGRSWQGAKGRSVPINAPHLTGTTTRIEELRPKSPRRYNRS